MVPVHHTTASRMARMRLCLPVFHLRKGRATRAQRSLRHIEVLQASRTGQAGSGRLTRLLRRVPGLVPCPVQEKSADNSGWSNRQVQAIRVEATNKCSLVMWERHGHP